MGSLIPSASAVRGPRLRQRRFRRVTTTSWIVALALTASVVFGQEPYTFQVISDAAHETDAFTQGYEIHGDFLYESVGLYGQSALRKIRIADGDEVQRVEIPSQYFAEGLTILNGRIYQLTWREQTAFVYDLETLESTRTFFYAGEGWGLTNDGTNLFQSDGTATIRVRTADTFEVIREIQVTENGATIANLNELEWFEGNIWANVWFSTRIVIIAPESGQVIGSLDLAPIARRHTNRFLGNVLNGIAAHPEDNALWITGKRWPKRYKLRIAPIKDISKPAPRLKSALNTSKEAILCFPTYNQFIYRLETRSRISASTPWRTSEWAHVGDGFLGQFTSPLPQGAATLYFRLRVE